MTECIEHLNVTALTYFERLEPARRRGRECGLLADTFSERRTLLGQYILKALRRPALRLKAPRVFRPARADLDFGDVCDRFRGAQRTFGELLERASGLDLGRIKLPTPVSRFIRLTAAEAFEIHALHEERHLRQAEAVVASPGFPDSTG